MTSRSDKTPSGSEILLALRRSVSEEAAALRLLVDNEDSCCLARIQRRSRLATMEQILDLFDLAETWEW